MTAVAMVDIKVDKGVHPDEAPQRPCLTGKTYRLKGPPFEVPLGGRWKDISKPPPPKKKKHQKTWEDSTLCFFCMFFLEKMFVVIFVMCQQKYRNH